MELESWLPYSQEPATGPYPTPNKSCPHSRILFLQNTFYFRINKQREQKKTRNSRLCEIISVKQESMWEHVWTEYELQISSFKDCKYVNTLHEFSHFYFSEYSDKVHK